MPARSAARHQSSTLGVAAVSSAGRRSRRARSSTTSRECRRGGPGGLWAASCSSTSASRAAAGSGASSAERVPMATRAVPWPNRAHASSRAASATPESRRTADPRRPSRCAQRAAPSTSDTITSARGAAATRSSSRRSRPAPISSSTGATAPASLRALAGAAGSGAEPFADDGAGGGRSAAHVDPTEESDSRAIHSTSCSRPGVRTGVDSLTPSSGLRLDSSPSRRPTTMPTRRAPRSGARTRWPRATGSPEGTR
jgi:hypothetical protein